MTKTLAKIVRLFKRVPPGWLDAGVLFFFACLYFWPYLSMQKSMVAYDLLANIEPWASQSDIAYKNFLMSDVIKQRVPWETLYRSAWLSGEIPFWNPYASGGMPFLANHMSEVFYPLNALFLGLPLDAGFTVFSLIHKYITGVGMYLFLRRMNLHRYSAMFGAVTWMYAGSLTLWLPWLQNIASLTWIPWALWLVERVMTESRWRDVGFLAVTIALIFLGGHIQFAYYGFLVVSFYALWRFFTLRRPLRQRFKPLLMIGAGGALGLALTAVQFLPTLELSGRISRSATSIQAIMAAGLPIENLLMLVVPEIFGDANQFNVRGNFTEFGGYMGILTLAMFVAALFYPGWKKNRNALFFPVMVFVSLMLIHRSNLNLIMAYIPGYRMFQTVFRLLSVWCFAAAGFAAIGMEAILLSEGWRRKVLGLVGGGGILLGGILLVKQAPVVYRVERYFELPAFESAAPFTWAAWMVLLAGLVIVLLVVGLQQTRQYHFALFALPLIILSADMLKFSFDYLPITDVPSAFPTAPSIEFLQAHRGLGRIARFRSGFLGGPIPPNMAVMYGLEDFDAYDSFSIRQYAELIGAVEPRRFEMSGLYNQMYGFEDPASLRSPLMNLMRISFLLSLHEIPDLVGESGAGTAPRWVEAYRGPDGIIYQNLDVLPLAGIYGKFHVAISDEEVRAVVGSGKFDPAREIWLTAEPPAGIDPAASGEVQLTGRTNNTLSLRVLVEADAGRSGILMIAQNDYPGWRAKVDGVEVDIFSVYTTWQGIVVPAGSHDVRLWFMPNRFGQTAFVSAIALGLVLGLILGDPTTRNAAEDRGPRRRG